MADITRHRPLVCEAIDMAVRRRPHTTGGDDPPRPGPAAPWHASAQLADHPEDHGARPPGGQDQGVLGGRPGGSRRAPPSRNERAYQMAHHHKKQDHPRYCPLRPSPVHTIRDSPTPPRGTGHPARPTRTTEQQDKQLETQPSRLPKTHPAAQAPPATLPSAKTPQPIWPELNKMAFWGSCCGIPGWRLRSTSYKIISCRST